MTGILTNLSMAILFTWALSGLIGIFAPPLWALAIGAGAGVLLALPLRQNMVLRSFNALLDPLGIVLPLLALRSLLGGFDVEMVAFSTPTLLVFVILHVLFLAASTDKLPFDPYRLGYAPIPVALMALALCGLGALHGSLFLPLLAVLAQVFWVMRWGSSNFFDHILHAVLVPVVLIELLTRLLGT